MEDIRTGMIKVILITINIRVEISIKETGVRTISEETNTLITAIASSTSRMIITVRKTTLSGVEVKTITRQGTEVNIIITEIIIIVTINPTMMQE